MQLLKNNRLISNMEEFSKMHQDTIKYFRNRLLENTDEFEIDVEYVTHNLQNSISMIEGINNMVINLVYRRDFYAINVISEIVSSCIQRPDLDLNAITIMADNIGDSLDLKFKSELDLIMEEGCFRNFININMLLNKFMVDKMAKDSIKDVSDDREFDKIKNYICSLMDEFTVSISYTIEEEEIHYDNKSFFKMATHIFDKDIFALDQRSRFEDISIDDIIGV